VTLSYAALLVAALLLSPDAAAKDVPGEAEAAIIEGIPPGPPPPAEQVNQIAYGIGLKIRCPVCQGLSISDSTSPAAVQMQQKVRDLVAAGYAEPEIIDYFVDRYGEFLILDPQADDPWTTTLLYVGPGLLLGLGAGMALYAMQGRRRAAAGPDAALDGVVVKDEYEKRLLAELED
jgi:cytochrome c-type biogenesis protein CcmH/NrfF